MYVADTADIAQPQTAVLAFTKAPVEQPGARTVLLARRLQTGKENANHALSDSSLGQVQMNHHPTCFDLNISNKDKGCSPTRE